MGLCTYNTDPNAFVRLFRHVYHPLAFKKGYTFLLFFIFGGALVAFCLARLQYLSIDGILPTHIAPGEFYYYHRTFYKVGIALHLACILPAGILAVIQFVPVIRHKALIFHRINGYTAIILLVGGNIGALMIARHSFGGTMATQGLVGVLAISTLGSAFLAYYNVKRLQIDQHRAWMLRCWFYAGSIITLRLIMGISGVVISRTGGFYIAMPCQQIAYMGGDATAYPACRVAVDGQTAVLANMVTPSSVEQVASSLQITFASKYPLLWMDLLPHTARCNFRSCKFFRPWETPTNA